MDSCVSTAIAGQGHGSSNIAVLHASYGQRTQERERRAFDEVANFYGVRERLIVQLDHFRAIGGAALTGKKIFFPGKEIGGSGAACSAVSLTDFSFLEGPFFFLAG